MQDLVFVDELRICDADLDEVIQDLKKNRSAQHAMKASQEGFTVTITDNEVNRLLFKDGEMVVNGRVLNNMEDGYKVEHTTPITGQSWKDIMINHIEGIAPDLPRLTDEAAQELFNKVNAADPAEVQEKWRIAEELSNALMEFFQANERERMERIGRKMMKELRPGKIVYYVHALGQNSGITKYQLVSKPYGKDLGLSEGLSPFIDAHMYSQYDKKIRNHVSCFSLGDCNVIPNHYNEHRLFLTPQAAQRYLEWAKVNTNAPEVDDDYWMWGDY